MKTKPPNTASRRMFVRKGSSEPTILLSKGVETCLRADGSSAVMVYLNNDKTKLCLEPLVLPKSAVVRMMSGGYNQDTGSNTQCRLSLIGCLGLLPEGARVSAVWNDVASRIEIDLAPKSE